MTSESFKALLIDDDPVDARLVGEMLARGGFARFDLEVTDRLADGIRRVSHGDIDVVLVDLCLPDSQGVNTIAILRAHAPDLPIVVLTETTDEPTGVQALNAGAQEYLLKDQATGVALVRALRYAIERKRLELALHRMTLVDDLTGLYNRRGFFQRAPRRLTLAIAEQKRALLALVDMDGLKQINDTHGHLEGDKAIMMVAAVLKGTLRDDDIIARIGGDEFAVLAIVNGPNAERAILSRLDRNFAEAGTPAGYAVSVSLGFAALEANDPAKLDDLIKRADQSLYDHKRSKGRTPPAPPKPALQEHPPS
jgi:two-component system, cell cycle response regulator